MKKAPTPKTNSIRSAGSTEHRLVTDIERQTDRQTPGHNKKPAENQQFTALPAL